MRKDQVKLSNVQNLPQLVTSGTFDNHMLYGDNKGQSHTGLHLLANFLRQTGHPLTNNDLINGQQYIGTLNNRQTTVTITEVDPRTKTFRASVNIYGTAKVSTFFPLGTTLAQAKNYIMAAWRDYCTYGTGAHGGGAVDIYVQMKAANNLNWAGMATIGGQETWIGCAHAGPVDTAFPAVNNKFG